jgi:hypothetical protein
VRDRLHLDLEPDAARGHRERGVVLVAIEEGALDFLPVRHVREAPARERLRELGFALALGLIDVVIGAPVRFDVVGIDLPEVDLGAEYSEE